MSARSILGAVVIVTVALGLTGCSVATSYVDKATEKLSADNVEAEYAHVIEGWQALTTAADNACLASTASPSASSPTLVESPALAYAATYRNARADFNARQADIFKAGFVGPTGHPSEIPNFAETIGADPDFCAVSTRLAELKAQAE